MYRNEDDEWEAVESTNEVAVYGFRSHLEIDHHVLGTATLSSKFQTRPRNFFHVRMTGIR